MSKLLDRPWLLIGLAAGVALAVWVVSTRTQTHHVRVAFDEAVSVATGQDVQVNGVDVGKVSGVELEDGQPIVELGIDDERVWPLTRGTEAVLRFGTTIGNGTRRVDLLPGPAEAPEISEDGLISARATDSPTEFDELFDTLDVPTRAALQSGQQRIARTVAGKASRIADGIDTSAAAFTAAGGVFSELASDDVALREAIAHTSGVTRTLAGRADRITALMTVAARTFETFAANTNGIRTSLERVPPTFAETRETLARLEPSLDRLDRLVADVAPGARALRPLAAAARPALADLRSIVPQAVSTVRTARSASPRIATLLDAATPLVRDVAPVLRDGATITNCVRPYAPEIAGFLSNWSSFSQVYDRYSSTARVRAVAGDTSFTDVPDLRTSEFTNLTGAGYAGLRPPGLNGGKPWFLPECGVGEDVLDPAQDWEDDR